MWRRQEIKTVSYTHLTHNACGGVAISPEDFSSMVSLAKNRGLSVHLDGARIFNAAIAWGVEPIVYTESVDSVQFCLSKGLGTPIGSLICGSKDYIRRARHWRKRVGGGLRQAGVIAAAGIIALRNYPDLRHDHEKAKILKDRLTSEGVKVVEAVSYTHLDVYKRQAKGLSVLAHPGEMRLTFDELEKLLEKLKSFGLWGLECYSSHHRAEDIFSFLKLADKFDLQPTAGSDFHGSIRPGFEMGIDVPNHMVPEELISLAKKKIGNASGVCINVHSSLSYEPD